MNTLIIEPKQETPSITLDKEGDFFQISGKSLPENVVEFYQPVFEWLNNYLIDPNEETIFKFQLVYYNSASSKIILNILKKLEEIKKSGKSVKVEWHFNQDDEDMEEAGQEYEEILDLEFQFFPYV